MKSSNWQEAETILALDLYFKLDDGQMHGKNPFVIELSVFFESIQSFNSSINDFCVPVCRTVGSISLKLANFKRLDKNCSGKGMIAGSKTDIIVWERFYSNRNKLKREALKIRAFFTHPNKQSGVLPFGDSMFRNYSSWAEEIGLEMSSLFGRDASLLVCSICSLSFFEVYGNIGFNAISFSYKNEILEVHTLNPIDSSKIKLICCNCRTILGSTLGSISYDELDFIVRNGKDK